MKQTVESYEKELEYLSDEKLEMIRCTWVLGYRQSLKSFKLR